MRVLLCYSAVFLLISVFAVSCQQRGLLTSKNLELLCKEWVQLHEEIHDSGEVFRSSTLSIPPARGRVRWIFMLDGTLIYMPISPNDAPMKIQGTWKKKKGDVIVLDFESNESYATKHSRRILFLDNEKMIWSYPIP